MYICVHYLRMCACPNIEYIHACIYMYVHTHAHMSGCRSTHVRGRRLYKDSTWALSDPSVRNMHAQTRHTAIILASTCQFYAGFDACPGCLTYSIRSLPANSHEPIPQSLYLCCIRCLGKDLIVSRAPPSLVRYGHSPRCQSNKWDPCFRR